jgi:hypothetical protein
VPFIRLNAAADDSLKALSIARLDLCNLVPISSDMPVVFAPEL